MKSSVYTLYDLAMEKFYTPKQPEQNRQHFARHNLLLYPFPGFHKLYTEIRNFFHEVVKPEEPYYIQCWHNVYKYGDFNEWHRHWMPEAKSWHGFYCVDVEPSYTSYKLPHRTDIVDIQSRNNLLVLARGNDDIHRSSQWDHQDRDRITLGYDMVPAKYLFKNFSKRGWLNHWVPL